MDPPGPGRPAGGHGLTAALIARQDAQSRRTAGQIDHLLETHVRPEDVAHEEKFIAELFHRRLLEVPAQVAAAIAATSDQGEVWTILQDALLQALTDLAHDPTDPDPLPADPTLARAEECPDSDTLDEARARSARLRARFIELRMRVRPC